MSKMKMTLQRFFFASLTLPLIIVFQNCGSRKMDFSQDSAALASTSSEASTANQSLAVSSDQFTITGTSTTQKNALDMIWVVDNSGSMYDTASIVRNNIESFLKSIDANSDFRFLLISKKGVSNAQVSLPNTYLGNSKFKQIDYQVESNDGAKILLDHLENTIPTIKSQNYALNSFFRADSKKAIIFVTDDESYLNSNTIQNRLDSISGWRNQYTVYGFIGLGSSASPCQANTGNIYINLANNTGGNTFNICDNNWTQHFSNLQNNVIAQINIPNFVTLSKDNVNTISAVYINSVKVDPSKYTISKSGKKTKITFKDTGKLKNNDKIKVDYTYNK